jgi:phage terminase Nu1 subunit (DNA packaging protein)
VVDLSAQHTQSAVAAVVGVSQQAISAMQADGRLPSAGTNAEIVHAYCARLREQAAGRYTEGPLDLSQERAALAREQRAGLEIKNAVLRGDYAAVTLLADVLATASQAVSERFDHLPGVLKKACPQLDDAARDQVVAVIAAARNEWVRATAELVRARLAEDDDEPELDFVDAEDEPRPD